MNKNSEIFRRNSYEKTFIIKRGVAKEVAMVEIDKIDPIKRLYFHIKELYQSKCQKKLGHNPFTG